jgi:hypothetical protein
MDDKDIARLIAWGLYIDRIVPLGPHTYAVHAHQDLLVYKQLQHPDWLCALPQPLRTYAPPVLKVFDDAPYAQLMPHCGVSMTLHASPIATRWHTWQRIIDFLSAMHVRALSYTLRIPTYDPLNANISIDTAFMDDPTVLYALERALWGKTRNTTAQRTLTHGDAHPGNVTTDGENMWLIDWDFCRIASPMRDIASLLVHEQDTTMRHNATAYAIAALINNGYPSYGLEHDAPLCMCDQAWQWLQWTSTQARTCPHAARIAAHMVGVLQRTVPLLL